MTQSTIFTIAVFSKLGASASFQGLEHMMYSGKQSKMDLFILERGRQRGEHISVFSCLMESYGEDESRKLSEMHSKMMRSNGPSSPLGKFRLQIKNKICTTSVLKHWERFPERLWNLCPHGDSKLDWTRPWADFEVGPLLNCGYWRRWRPEVPSKQSFMILWFPLIAVSLTAWHTSREKSWHDMGSANKQLH